MLKVNGSPDIGTIDPKGDGSSGGWADASFRLALRNQTRIDRLDNAGTATTPTASAAPISLAPTAAPSSVAVADPQPAQADDTQIVPHRYALDTAYFRIFADLNWSRPANFLPLRKDDQLT
jgi:hypothetical protein